MFTELPLFSSLAASVLLAQEQKGGPLGPEFGKASPIGLFIIVLLVVVVLTIGYLANRRIKRMERRKRIAEEHGISVFDTDELGRIIDEEDQK